MINQSVLVLFFYIGVVGFVGGVGVGVERFSICTNLYLSARLITYQHVPVPPQQQ